MDLTQEAPQPYQIIRPLGLTSQSNFSREIRLDYGPLFITSVCFESYHDTPDLSFPQLQRRSRLDRQSPGRRLLVSHMYSPIFLFDLKEPEETLEEFAISTDQPSQVRVNFFGRVFGWSHFLMEIHCCFSSINKKEEILMRARDLWR